ncbi:MAG: deoxyribodipyrimidine photo-lyase [Gammaproteobacteria bacterium]|nr:MAG: deoxyribodipyrimidine photo-lyase [Gammaproteobacteria bacterium]
MPASSAAPVIVWFRQDLRLADNPALTAAVASGQPVLPVYVLDDENAGPAAMGGASRWWLHHSLAALNESLDGRLCCLRGAANRLVPELARASGATAVHVNRCVEPWRRERDREVAAALGRDGIDWRASVGSTLFDPEQVAKADGSPYRVFTPFYRKGCLTAAPAPRTPLAAPGSFSIFDWDGGTGVDGLALLPRVAWYRGIERAWQVGERAAGQRLAEFLEHGLSGYRDGRDRPDREQVSRLSPHLHFGEISPNKVWYSVLPLANDARISADVDRFMSELGWREFSYYLLWHWPELPAENLQKKFDRFPWQQEPDLLARWCRGQTGYPMVDAGMRELWQTGYMHNRVRMIVASFLVKNLLIDWRQGAAWFWDTLVDADLANNSASWQWVAGCGADAAPYFRIFNPVTQGRKFDPHGSYLRRFLPELAALDTRYLHAPWEAPAALREGLDYPEPMVELKASRERALAAFRSLTR